MPRTLESVLEKHAPQRAYNAVRVAEEVEKLARSLKLSGDDIEAIMAHRQIAGLGQVNDIVRLFNAINEPGSFERELIQARRG